MRQPHGPRWRRNVCSAALVGSSGDEGPPRDGGSRCQSVTRANAPQTRPEARALPVHPACQHRIDGSVLCGVHTKREPAVTALLPGYEDLEKSSSVLH